MSYIIKKNDPLVNIKLTDEGRKNLAEGALNFTYFSLSDSEMDYSSDNPSSVNILRPADNRVGIASTVPPFDEEPYELISTINAVPNEVYTSAKERGFFDYTGTTIQPSTGLASVFNITGQTTGDTTTIDFVFNANSIKNNDFIDLKPGDYVFVK